MSSGRTPHVYLGRTSDERELALPADRSHYLVRVLRLGRGDRVIGFSGDGRGVSLEIVDPHPSRCRVRLGDTVLEEPPPAMRLYLAPALIKGERFDWVVQKATELGVTEVWPIEAERGEVHLARERLERRLDHWAKIAAAACEQSGRLRVPAVHAPQRLDSLASVLVAGDLESSNRLFLDPGADVLVAPLPRADTLIAVGPEGGWTDAERNVALASGFRPVGLGGGVLRADTASLAALAAVRQAWAWQL